MEFYNRVELCGWMYRPREIGKFLFCDLKIEKKTKERTFLTFIQVFGRKPEINDLMRQFVNRKVFITGVLTNTKYFGGAQVSVGKIYPVNDEIYVPEDRYGVDGMAYAGSEKREQ